ncbi:MAG TPA: CobD/CbiB family protein [Burkholderiaceae bacterium]|nr:CobD/CbiB family protein [Burkholderiaceae bacterium]
MTWLALVLTLLLEQVRPMRAGNALHRGAAAVVDAAARNLNAGRRHHGIYAWILVIGGALIATLATFFVALQFSRLVALAFDVIVLYATLGFRQFSHSFTAIQRSLNGGDFATARTLLAEWRAANGEPTPASGAAEPDPTEIVRQSIETGLWLAHRRVFGTLFWFVILPGPSGPVLYRLAQSVARRWRRPPDVSSSLPPDRFGDFARVAFAVIDWLPARATAFAFAIVGDFEGAIYCWRRLPAAHFEADGVPAPDARTVILAAASGALGGRVLPEPEAARLADEPGGEGAGLAEPDLNLLRSAVGLVWRAMVFWVLLLLVLSIVAFLA